MGQQMKGGLARRTGGLYAYTISGLEGDVAAAMAIVAETKADMGKERRRERGGVGVMEGRREGDRRDPD
jgi:hypothetical protein